MEKTQTFFDFAAEVGLTKHLGGLGATEELIELCHIGEGKYVLDVGCGAGVTPCFIARRYGCRVVGVDISKGMVERYEERAKREGVADRVEFRVADAQDLPFDDDLFRCRHYRVRNRLSRRQTESGQRVRAGDEAGRIRRAQ